MDHLNQQQAQIQIQFSKLYRNWSDFSELRSPLKGSLRGVKGAFKIQNILCGALPQ